MTRTFPSPQVPWDEFGGNDPLEGGHTSLMHCAWVYDFDEHDMGRGYAFGEFFLRDDGVLFCRQGGDSSPGDGSYRYVFGPWKVDRRWHERDVDACLDWLNSIYELYEPSPVPIGRSTSELYEGTPGLALPLSKQRPND